MELKTGRSRAGSVVAGGYDELLTPICETQSEPFRGAASATAGRTYDGDNGGGVGAVVSKRSSQGSGNDRKMSVRTKQSVHEAEIRRQASSGPVDGGELRVKSTVSGFLNRDYYTPNDSVPLIRVSESYTRLFHHTSDEDTDSEVEEVVEKKFGTEAKNLKDALKTNFAVRKSATGIPRMEGHMRLPDRKTAQTDAKDRLYRGRSYLVELPHRLERSTRALTRTAIARALEEERLRRVSELRQRGADISPDWLAVQAELRQLARAAQQEEVESTITTTQASEDHMQLVREQLVQQVHRKAVRAEVAEAQQWKQMFFKGISKNRLPSDAMEAVATTSEHLSSVLQQLTEAFSCSDIDESSRQEAVQERAQDLKDACLTELMRCVVAQKIKIEITVEAERQVRQFKRGRPAAARRSQSRDEVDLGAAKHAVGGALDKIFRRVADRQVKRDDRIRDRVAEYKTVCQEELIRKVWRRHVTALCCHEKARRIIEAEHPAVMDDPDRARISDHWVRVQAQMIVDVFRGKKPTKRTSVTEVLQDRSGSPSPIRSALDRRLKAVRERFRRPAVYFCDEDDTFVRERVRRRTSLSAVSQARLGSRGSLLHSPASEPARRRRSSGGSASPPPHRRQPSAAARGRRASEVRSPSRQSSAARSASRHSVTTRRGSRRNSVAAGSATDRPSSAAGSATDRPSSAAGGTAGGSRRQSSVRGRPPAAAPAAARSSSFVTARSVSPEPRPSVSRRRSGSREPAAAVARGSQSPPPAGILKNAESARRASSEAPSPRQSPTKPSRTSASASRADTGPRGPSGAAGAGADVRRSPSGGGSTRRGRSGGDVKELVAPRWLTSDAESAEAASRSYRRRGEKTEEFRQERREIIDRREHEHSQKLERKRSRSAGKTSDQYRSHWTAHIQE